MRVVFMGTGEIGLPSFRWLLASPEHEVLAVVTQPDKPVGRRQELHASAIKQLAVAQGVRVLQPVKMRAPEAVAEIVALAPDAIVVMAYGQILPRAVLAAPRLACLNLHASLLPRWRGAAPIQAAIEAGDDRSGVTVMYMAEGLDTGDILLMKETPISASDTGGSLHDRLGEIAAHALAEALPLVAAGTAPRTPQDDAQATHAAKLSRENGRLDWTATMAEIDRRIRAMNPWPAAHTFLPEPPAKSGSEASAGAARQLKIFGATLQPGAAGRSGEVLAADARGLLVAAADGAVLVHDLQLEGKRRMAAGEFLRGYPIAPGSVLGSSAPSAPNFT